MRGTTEPGEAWFTPWSQERVLLCSADQPSPHLRSIPAKPYGLEAQRKNSHDKTSEPLSPNRRLVGRRSRVQTRASARGRIRPRAKKGRRARLQGIGFDEARQRSARTFSRGWAGVAGARQRGATAGGGVVGASFPLRQLAGVGMAGSR